jgi:hypothetical protein
VLSHGDAWRRLVAKVGTSNPDRTISLEAAMRKLKIIIIIIIIIIMCNLEPLMMDGKTVRNM